MFHCHNVCLLHIIIFLCSVCDTYSISIVICKYCKESKFMTKCVNSVAQGWKDRYFRLKNGKLYYYKDSKVIFVM